MSRNRDRREAGFLLLTVVLSISAIAAVTYLLSRESSFEVDMTGAAAAGLVIRYVAEAGFRHGQWAANQSECRDYRDVEKMPFGGHTYSIEYASSEGSPVEIEVTAVSADGSSHQLKRSSKVVSETGELVLQPNAVRGKDAYVSEAYPDLNAGTAEMLLGWNSKYHYPLLEFDINSLPAGVDVLSATLELYGQASGDDVEISVYPMRTNWTEGSGALSPTGDGATWETPHGTAPPTWSWPDAFDGGYLVSRAYVDPTDQWYQWDITPLVSAWNTGALDNHGLVLTVTAPGSSFYFRSSDHPSQVRHPKLTIRYGCECGSGCDSLRGCDADYAANLKVGKSMDNGSYGVNTGLTYLPAGYQFRDTLSPPGGSWLSIDRQRNLYMTDLSGSAPIESCTTDGGVAWLAAAARGVAFMESGPRAGQLAVVFTALGASGIVFVNLQCDVVAGPLWQWPGFTGQFGGVDFIEETASGGYPEGHLALADLKYPAAHVYSLETGFVETFDLAATTGIPVDDSSNDFTGIANLPGQDAFAVVSGNRGRVYIVDANSLLLLNSYQTAGFDAPTPRSFAINPLTCDHAFADRGDVARNASVVWVNHGSAVKTWTFDPVVDTYIKQDDSGSDKSDSHDMHLGGNSAPDPANERRMLLKFDVVGLEADGKIPQDSLIHSARLRLYLHDKDDPEPAFLANAHPLDQEWDSDASWDEPQPSTDPGAAWESTCGTHDCVVLDSVMVNTAQELWHEWDVTALVSEWVNDPPIRDPYGILIARTPGPYDSDPKPKFRSAHSDNDEAEWPKLVIEWEAP